MAKRPIAERLLEYAQHNVHPQVRTWSDAARIAAALEEELASDLERLESDSLAALFRHHCPVAGAEQGDYKNRLVRVGRLELLTGIRFLNLDMAEPFVDVIYRSEAALNVAQLEAIKEAIRREYAVFTPKRLRLYQMSLLPPLPGEGDKRLVAAPLGLIVKQALTSARVELKQATSLEFYPEYAAIYASLHAEHPELVPVAAAESADDLQGFLEDENLLEILVDGAWAGICAVFPDVAAGLRGFCFGEIVLAPAFRGQGLGSAVQFRLADLLVARGEDPGAFLFGAIGTINSPAQRAAARAGRVDLGGYSWTDL